MTAPIRTEPEARVAPLANLTGWFPADIKPVRNGAYDVGNGLTFIAPAFKWWNGSRWGGVSNTPRAAYTYRDWALCEQHNIWRGLTRKQK